MSAPAFAATPGSTGLRSATTASSAISVRHDSRTRLLLEAPIARTLLRLAAPNVLVMLAQASVGLIETQPRMSLIAGSEADRAVTSGYGGPVRQAALDLAGDEFFRSKSYRQELLADRIRCLSQGILGSGSGGRFRIEQSLNLRDESGVGKRLSDEFDTRVQPALVNDGILRVARREQHG
jgi:hypothetical protein